MTDFSPEPYEIINQTARLEIAAQGLSGALAIALDTESNSRHHYPEQLCLIQIACGRQIYIIDTLALKELAPLKRILEDQGIQKIIHGADYDIRCFDRHYGFRIRNLYDTSVAARLAGITEFGLAALIKNLLGVTILKSERLQQADWGRRPLSVEALEYAAGDVHHLLALRDILEQRLRDLGRTAWAAEEFARLEEVRYTAPNLQTAYLAVKGGQILDPGGLAVLRSLALFREEESVRQGRPPFFVIPDYALITLAANPDINLSKVSGLGQIGLQRFGTGLRQALREGQAAPPIQRPPNNVERLSPEQAARLSRLKAWRSALGISLALDPSLLWPTSSLERLAKAPATFDTEILSAGIRGWQRDQFKSSLSACLQTRI
jgi:ribonuclease D